MIVERCPSCGAPLTGRRARPDGTTDCPNCGRAVALPTVDLNVETVAPSDAPGAGRTLTHGGTGTAAGYGPIQVPGYEVLEEVGRGGMGVVYKARQLNPPRLVALKMILAGEHADPEQLARFRAEALAIARLTHPTITQIHQVGEWHPPEGGPAVPFLTLEYVPGHTLARRLRSGPPVSPRQAAALVRRLAAAVHHAHEQGIIHRDLKPGNVLLTGEEGPDSLGEPKIVDFGLAKPLDGFATTVSDGPQTRTGAILGTPSYMAPEQAASRKQIGPAADVYALGAVLYEMLTGRPPFSGESHLETLMRVASEEPEPPRRVRPNIPRDLETICLSCLAKDPARRYPSALALADDLGRFLGDQPVTVRPPSQRERLGRWVRRHRELAYLAAGALLALAVLVIARTRPPTGGEDQTAGPVAPQPPQPPNPGPPPDDSPIAEARRRSVSQGKLKQIAIALHNTHEVYGHLPPAAVCDKAGKPLLSWRVALLPYVEQDELYKQFHLDEPWDSEHNKKLIDQMPKIYSVEGAAAPPNMTHYQAIVGKGTAWEVLPQLGGSFGRKGLRMPADFPDGTANTILVAEGAEPVIWTKPDDLTFDGKRVPKFGGVVKNGFNAAMAGGSVWFLRREMNPTILLAALTRNGGEPLPPNWQASGETPPGLGTLDVSVTFRGKPLAGGSVTFHPDATAGGRRFGLVLGPDGKFPIAGIEPGRYRVTIVAPPGFPELPQQYTAPATSGLMVEIRPGVQGVNFDLTDEPPKK